MKDQILFWVNHLLEFKEELKQMAPLVKDAIPSIFVSPMYDLYECQILYTIIRVLKPKKIVDVGCGCGWTTFWILSAANKNDNGATVFTYDIAPSCVDLTKQNIARFNFSKVQWQTVLGNFMATAKQILPEPIDLLFLDADHTQDFAVFCVENIFPKLAKSHSIAIHDYGREEADYMLTQWYPQNRNRYCLLENLPQPVKDAVPDIEELLPLKQGDANKPCWPSPSLWFFHDTLNCPS